MKAIASHFQIQMSADASRTKISHLASIVQEMENRLSSRTSSKLDSELAILNQVGSLEESLRIEITRRADMERRINESIDNKIKVSIDRLADAVETEMTRMYRKMDVDLSNKIEAISRDLQALQAGRLALVERSIDTVEDMTRRNTDSITRLDTRLTAVFAEMPSTSAASWALSPSTSRKSTASR